MIKLILFAVIAYGAIVAIIFSVLQTLFPEDLIFPETQEITAMTALTIGLLIVFILMALLKLLSIY
jgi:ABC-type Fe3+-siderophore transport system permease subunit